MSFNLMMDNERIDVLKKIIEIRGNEYQCVVATEELAELTKEITKFIRGKGNFDNLVEEIADALIVINQLLLIFGITIEEVNETVKTKIERLKTRIDYFESSF